MALAGQASTHKPQGLPIHFCSSKINEKSSRNAMALTGQREKHAPQLKHFSLSTSISFGTVTVAPFFRKASITFSTCVEGTSARISPPWESMWAATMLMGTPCSRMTCAVMGCSTSFSENLRRILATVFTFPKVRRCLQR